MQKISSHVKLSLISTNVADCFLCPSMPPYKSLLKILFIHPPIHLSIQLLITRHKTVNKKDIEPIVMEFMARED